MRGFVRAGVLLWVFAFMLGAKYLSADSEQRLVSPGGAYGAALSSGLLVGAALGAAGATLPYSMERHNQDGAAIALGAVWGAVAGVAASAPLAAYEVATQKEGAATTILFDTLGFAILGGVVGAGSGMLSYRQTFSYAPNEGEAFLAATAGGFLGGALVGLGVGIFEAVIWDGPVQTRPKGKGVHARAGFLSWSPQPGGGRGRLVEVEF